MLTFNPQLKTSTSYAPNASVCQYSCEDDDEDVQRIDSTENEQCFQGKTHVPLFPSVNNSSRRNISYTSLPHVPADDEVYSKPPHADLKSLHILQAAKLVNDPSLVPGNLRKSKVPSATQILERFLRRASSDCDKRNEGGKSECVHAVKVKSRRKLNRSPKQKVARHHGPDIIYSTMLNSLAKSVNIYSKPSKIVKSGSNCSGVSNSESLHQELLLSNKIKADVSMKLVPQAQNSSVSKYQTSSQPNSSSVKYRNLKKASNTFEYMKKKNTLHRNDQVKLEKVNPIEVNPIEANHIKTQLSNPPDCDNETACLQPNAAKADSLTSNKQVRPLQDVQRRQPMCQKMPKVEGIATLREKRKSEKTYHAEKLTAKEIKFELKRKQRQEIYALNKVMTELENERFTQFMKSDELNT